MSISFWVLNCFPSQVSYDNTKPLTIAIITDAHIDPLYEPYGVAECAEPTCCRKGQTRRNNKYLYSPSDEDIALSSLKDVNGESVIDVNVGKILRHIRNSTIKRTQYKPPAGYWGDYRNCDTPLWAYEDVIDRIHTTHKVEYFFTYLM